MIRIAGPKVGFLAGVAPSSECLNHDGQPIGSEWDPYARRVTPEEAATPLVDLFAAVPQEPLPAHWGVSRTMEDE